MANWFSASGPTKFSISIPRHFTTSYTEYEVIIQFPSNISWKLRKRYSEFLTLYNQLVTIDPTYRVYFPPKKILKVSESFIVQRRRLLENYINEIISFCNNYIPRPLASFLEMDKYEIHGITTKLAKMLSINVNHMVNEITVLTLYAINQRMLSPAPTNIYNKPKEDFGNVLELIESTEKIKIIPHRFSTQDQDNQNFIKTETLPFDISIFSGAKTLELNSVEISNMRGLYKMNPVVENLRAHHCLKSLEDILFGDLVYRSSPFEDLLNFDGPWRCCTDVNFSKNSITSIDTSVVTLKQVSKLNLSNNQISEIDNLSHLIFLRILDLSFNNLFMSQNLSFSNKLGSIKQLFLKGNKLTKLTPIDRMFSLEYLDISENEIGDFSALLPFCRLSCLETLIFTKNPICEHSHFYEVIFDLFLDQYNSVKINGNTFMNLPLNSQNDISNRRIRKVSMLLDTSGSSVGIECSGEVVLHREHLHLLMSTSIDGDYITEPDSVLNIPEVFNSIIYWFYSATRKSVVPSKLLWCTEIFSPNQYLKPAPVLLISCTSLNASLLKCSIKTSGQDGKGFLTIQAKQFIDLNKNMKNLIIGADKSYIRFDMTTDRSLYLVNNMSSVDSLMGHLYHVDHEIVGYGDSRLVFLNEEDRMESLQRFVDVWRLDMVNTLSRSGENRTISMDAESEILFSSRAMLHMQNGFQLLLTVVVTRQMLCLVDERIYDWPEFAKKLNTSEFPYSNSSPNPFSSSSQFQFLRINAYFHNQIASCVVKTQSNESNLLAKLCPIFGNSLQIGFHINLSNSKEPIHLFFESAIQTENVYQLINQLCENEKCSITTNIICPEPIPQKHDHHEIPVYLKYLTSSYHETRLSLSLHCPQLSKLSSTPHNEIVSFCLSKINTENLKINGIIWSKFIYQSFEAPESFNITHEIVGLVCLSSENIWIFYELKDELTNESEGWSDPESDQPDNYGQSTKLGTITISLSEIFQIFIGLYSQWVTLCCRINENSSETSRIALITRNSDLTKQFVGWLKSSYKDTSTEDSFSDKLGNVHDTSNVDELLFQIRKTAGCEDITLIHYTSVEDVRFDNLVSIDPSQSDSSDIFTYAVVISTKHVTIIRHNVAEYPVRFYSRGAVRQSPKHLQYQILMVVPLHECLQLQLPGHDKNLLVIIIQSRSSSKIPNVANKIQLSISCQKEQKHLIDKLRQQWITCLQVDTPLRVIVC